MPPPPLMPGAPARPQGLPQVIPPYATACSPKYLAATVNAVPANLGVRARAQVPIGVVFRPLANPPASAEPLPVVHFGAAGVVRCRNCRSYISPYVTFLEQGSAWRCNFCFRNNEVHPAYFASIDAQGRRADLAERPELTQSSYEIVATSDYMMRAPMPPMFFFVIDVSAQSVRSGYLKTISETILSCLDDISTEALKRTRIGFITFDSSVHCYELRAGASAPRMHSLTDLSDLFQVVPSGLQVNLQECRELVQNLLENLPSMHANTNDVECAAFPALKLAAEIISRIGGKIMLFTAGLPSIGQGRLENRENPRALGTPDEALMLRPASSSYMAEALAIVKYQITVDVFAASPQDQFVDVATLNELAKFTGGQTRYYPRFTVDSQGPCLRKDLTRVLTRVQGWESVVRVRATEGVTLGDPFGNFYLRQTNLLISPCVDCDKSIALEIKTEPTELSVNAVCIQGAVLYTTSFGERRIRVHTLCLPVAHNVLDVLQRTNVNAAVNLLAKQAIHAALNSNLPSARELVLNRCTAALRAYRALAANSNMYDFGELQGLSQNCLALIKCAALKDGTDVRVDARSAAMASMMTMGLLDLEVLIRPRLLPLHEMQGAVGMVSEDGLDGVELPMELTLTSEQLRSHGAYLIDNGQDMYLRLGKALPQHWLQDVFGDVDVVRTPGSELRLRAIHSESKDAVDVSSQCRRVHNIVNYLRRVSASFQRLHIVKEGEAAEHKFFSLLTEDAGLNTPSHVQYIGHVLRGG